MANLFPKWFNWMPHLAGAGLAAGGLLTAGLTAYLSPEFTHVGYRPVQPLDFSHKLHAGEMEIDCRYCHNLVDRSPIAGIPSTQTCMNCHNLVARDSQKLEAVRASQATGEPLRWVRVHKLPEYAYFNHAAHIRAQVGCASCHGDVASMERVLMAEPLSMSWCLDCHRDPAPHLRPREEITNTAWSPPEDHSGQAQAFFRSIH